MRIIPHTGDIIPMNTSEGVQYGSVKFVSPHAQLPYAGVEVNGKFRTYTFAELQDTQDVMKDVKVIALTGESRAGKSRIAEGLSREYNETGLTAQVMSFADPLREMAYDLDMAVDQKNDGSPLGWQQAYEESVNLVVRDRGCETGPGPEFDRTVHDYMKVYHYDYRDVLYRVADVVKAHQPDFFATLLYDKLRDLAGYGVKRFIIDDLRFTVEYELLKAMVPDFTVNYILTEDQAEEPDTHEAQKRRDWVQGTGGVVFVTRGHTPRDVEADAHDMYDRHETELDQTEPDQTESDQTESDQAELDQGEKKIMKVKPGTMFFAHEGASLDDEEAWSAMGEVIDDGIDLSGNDENQVDFTIDQVERKIINQLYTGQSDEQVTVKPDEHTLPPGEYTIRPETLIINQQDPELIERITALETQLAGVQGRTHGTLRSWSLGVNNR